MKFRENLIYLSSKYPEVSNYMISDLKFEEGIKILEKISNISGYSIDSIINSDLEAIQNSFSKTIKLLALDVDGVMTDGGMYYTESGDEFKKYNTKDGMAIRNLTSKGFPVCILSSGFNKNLIERRAKLLGIEKVFVGRGKKIEVLKNWCNELGMDMKSVSYIGDDINDLEIIKEAGLTACPRDAIDLVKSEVNIILSLNGGKGCIREFIDKYIKETK